MTGIFDGLLLFLALLLVLLLLLFLAFLLCHMSLLNGFRIRHDWLILDIPKFYHINFLDVVS